jgi:DNA repair photolyase
MQIREVQAKTILTKSGITDYCINPYMGCGHGCSYCYAQLIIRKFHPGQKWGSYLDIKVNAPELLEKEITKVKKGTVMLSSVTDPYQPMEQKYRLTRKCLEILLEHDFPVSILTKSHLVTRDIDILKKFRDATVGVTVTTNDNKVMRLFEPYTPTFEIRIDTLKKLHAAGLKTYAFIGPILPMDSKIVGEAVADNVEFVYIDKLNYPYLWKKIADKNNLDLSREYFEKTKSELTKIFREKGIKVKTLF